MTMSEKLISWLEIRNWWPIMVAIVGIALYLGQMNQKLDNLIAIERETQAEFKPWKAQVEDRMGHSEIANSSAEVRLGFLERKLGVR